MSSSLRRSSAEWRIRVLSYDFRMMGTWPQGEIIICLCVALCIQIRSPYAQLWSLVPKFSAAHAEQLTLGLEDLLAP